MADRIDTPDGSGHRAKVRPVMREDRAAWSRLWGGYLAFYGTEVPQQIYDATFSRLLSDDPATFRGLIAEVDATPVGLVHYVLHPHCWRMEPVCYLEDLYVDPEVRGRGIGAMLMHALYEAADAEGAPQVYWMTQASNATARALYDRVGQLTPFVKYIRR